jgi:nitrogen fixation/metabolism regulation signal transduction histidine kinase
MSFATLKLRTGLNAGMAVILFASLLMSLLMIVDALQNSERFEKVYSILLLVNVMAILALLALVIFNLHHLLHQVRKKRAGASLTVRLVTLLVVSAIVPVIVVYYFSLEFLHQRIDNWFNLDVEHTLTEAFDLSRAALDAQRREAFKQTVAIAEEITYVSENMVTLHLNELRQRTGASELTLLAPNGHIIAHNSADIEHLLPRLPNESIWLQLKHSNNYISLEELTDHNLHIRVIIKLTINQSVRLLQALFPVPPRLQELTSSVEKAYINYQQKTYLQQPLKLSFTLVLSLVLLLCIFSTVWMAFFIARRFVAPLSYLAEGTIAVAKGNYEKQLPVKSLDELGFLVQSFNEMTRRIALARDEVKQNQQLADNQRAYLQAVLERLSSGVISLDNQQCLRTANPAAAQILDLPLDEMVGQSLTQLQNDYSSLLPLCMTVQPYLKEDVQDWREEITLFGTRGRKILMCRGTQLAQPNAEQYAGGYVIVFDDVTTLIQAQRDAAWSEVARRLAHEIKNPLTPIQLSAERLRQKYLPKLSPQEANTLDRMTHTIIQQVDTMKEMVNAFSDYAKTPKINKESLNLNQLVNEVLDLYHHVQSPIETQLDDKIPIIEADRGRLRQVLHNLLKNALDAQPTDNCITITSRHLTEACFECIELRIADQGPGIPKEILAKIFEPYVTTKPKGTGLGLAIVKKIIEEHHGAVWIEAIPNTCIVIRLPLNGSCPNTQLTFVN